MLTFFSIIILLLIIPIPIKFKLSYVDKNLNVYVYNINVLKKINSLKKKSSNKNKNKKKPSLENFKFIISSLDQNKFKPTLRLKLNSEYGLDDAACTAVFYGLISTFYPFLLRILDCFFKIKKQSIYIVPNFNKFIFKLEVNSIIFVNLAKVIYISYIICKSLKINRKVNFAKT